MLSEIEVKMCKRRTNFLFDLVLLSAIMIHAFGLKRTLDSFFQMLKLLNNFLLQLTNTSILTIMFKYCITFPLVGIFLSAIGSPRGKKGHIIGIVLYFIIGAIIELILNYIGKISL